MRLLSLLLLLAAFTSAEAGERLRLLSYNVWGAPFAAKDLSIRIPAIAREIPKLAPEILVFEEAFSGCFVPDIGRSLMRRTGYPFAARGASPLGLKCVDSGLVILSKYPIIKRSVMTYSGCTGFDCFSRKGALYVRIRVPGIGDIDVYATHTNAGGSDSIRLSQIDQFIKFVKRHSGDGERPAFFAGDFNATPDSAEMKRFRDELGLRDSYAEVNETNSDPTARDGFTCDGDRNGYLKARGEKRRARIDYVLYRQSRTLRVAAKASKSRMVFEESNSKGKPLSDHFGLMSEFEIGSP